MIALAPHTHEPRVRLLKTTDSGLRFHSDLTLDEYLALPDAEAAAYRAVMIDEAGEPIHGEAA